MPSSPNSYPTPQIHRDFALCAVRFVEATGHDLNSKETFKAISGGLDPDRAFPPGSLSLEGSVHVTYFQEAARQPATAHTEQVALAIQPDRDFAAGLQARINASTSLSERRRLEFVHNATMLDLFRNASAATRSRSVAKRLAKRIDQ